MFDSAINEHPWDKACKLRLIRTNPVFCVHEEIESGVNFFLLMLEALGAVTLFSCEGHPFGFYVCFQSDYDTALRISRAGFFMVEVQSTPGEWAIRLRNNERGDVSKGDVWDETAKSGCLRGAAASWVRCFGDLSGHAPRSDSAPGSI